MPQGESPENLGLMAEIDRQFLETPFFGARQMTGHLRAAGHAVNIKRVRRLMRLMGLMPIYRQPRTSMHIFDFWAAGMAQLIPQSQEELYPRDVGTTDVKISPQFRHKGKA